jgi:cobalt/nickel transport system ATP-binding protein
MQNDLEMLLHRLHTDGMTILLATHDIAFAYRWADRMLLLDHGRCVTSCDAAQIAEATGQLLALGLGVPEVILLQQLLLTKGLFPSGEPLPFSFTELIRLLEQRL